MNILSNAIFEWRVRPLWFLPSTAFEAYLFCSSSLTISGPLGFWWLISSYIVSSWVKISASCFNWLCSSVDSHFSNLSNFSLINLWTSRYSWSISALSSHIEEKNLYILPPGLALRSSSSFQLALYSSSTRSARGWSPIFCGILTYFGFFYVGTCPLIIFVWSLVTSFIMVSEDYGLK